MTDRQLVAMALDMRDKAYAPYSGYRVGAALLCDDGKVFGGCNVENGSYGATICAERTAAVSAIAAGNRGFLRLAIASSGDNFCVPCGICRQFFSEFYDGLVFLCARYDGEWMEYKHDDLLPHSFRLKGE